MAYSISFGEKPEQHWWIKNTLIDPFYDLIFKGYTETALREFADESTYFHGVSIDFDYENEKDNALREQLFALMGHRLHAIIENQEHDSTMKFGFEKIIELQALFEKYYPADECD